MGVAEVETDSGSGPLRGDSARLWLEHGQNGDDAKQSDKRPHSQKHPRNFGQNLFLGEVERVSIPENGTKGQSGNNHAGGEPHVIWPVSVGAVLWKIEGDSIRDPNNAAKDGQKPNIRRNKPIRRKGRYRKQNGSYIQGQADPDPLVYTRCSWNRPSPEQHSETTLPVGRPLRSSASQPLLLAQLEDLEHNSPSSDAAKPALPHLQAKTAMGPSQPKSSIQTRNQAPFFESPVTPSLKGS
ncbi:hypothetical protein HWI79_3252 [Cryptosporidium felis]|nr:hypothetical protein HWI79_3252 [Cryptosporidium felis]